MNRFLLLYIVIILFYFPCYISNDLLASLTDEDGLYESIGALLFLCSAITYALLASKPNLYNEHGERSTGKYPERWYFIFFTLLFIFGFGEEISWGQRIFNFSTPEALKEANVQKEFNLHNLEVFHGVTRDGKKKTGIMALFTMHRIYYTAFLTYLLIMPILYFKVPRIKSIIKKLHIPRPKLVLGILFAFNLVYGNILRTMNPNLEDHGVVEIKETAIALILFVLPLTFINFDRKNSKGKRQNDFH